MNIQRASNTPTILIQSSRKRQTPRPDSGFKAVLRGGAQVLLSGAAVAARLVGGPILSAAVTGSSALGAIPGTGTTAGGGKTLDAMTNLQDQRLNDDLQLLALQDKIQRNNRQISLASNVMKARHDTAKSAISNIRS